VITLLELPPTGTSAIVLLLAIGFLTGGDLLVRAARRPPISTVPGTDRRSVGL